MKRVADIEAYPVTNKYPRDLPTAQIFVDMDKESVFFPIGGLHVPFHISTIKNVTINDSDKVTSFRVNFYVPPAKGKDIPAAMRQVSS